MSGESKPKVREIRFNPAGCSTANYEMQKYGYKKLDNIQGTITAKVIK